MELYLEQRNRDLISTWQERKASLEKMQSMGSEDLSKLQSEVETCVSYKEELMRA